MTIYQKAIKVRKVCESKKNCIGCDYYYKCTYSQNILFSPVDEDINDIAKAIKEEKWKVK